MPNNIIESLTAILKYHKYISVENLKIHVAVDIRKKKIVSLEVTTEEVHNTRLLKKLVNHASENNNNVKRVIADGGYDSKENFRYLSDNGIQAAIKVKKRIHPARPWAAIQENWLYYSSCQILKDGSIT